MPILWGCGGDTTTPIRHHRRLERRVRPGSDRRGEAGTVGTQFNWVPDVEWAAWYLGDENGHFSERNVTSELGHGGPNTPAVVQVLAAGDGNVGLSASELDITQANKGSDYVIIGSMYQRNPLGLTWMKGTTIKQRRGPGRQADRWPAGRPGQFEAVLKINGLPTDQYVRPDELRPAAAGRRRDGRHHPLRHQPADPAATGRPRSRGQAVLHDFGLPSYGDILFASKAWIDENRDLLVRYVAGLLGGVEDNRSDPKAVIPILVEKYGSDARSTSTPPRPTRSTSR